MGSRRPAAAAESTRWAPGSRRDRINKKVSRILDRFGHYVVSVCNEGITVQEWREDQSRANLLVGGNRGL
jgi:hypothetical protein